MFKKILKFIGFLFLGIFLLGFIGAFLVGKKDTTKTPSAAVTRVDKKTVSKEIIDILGEIPRKIDEVEKQNIYQTWGEGSTPAERAIHWYAIEKDGNVLLRSYIIDFSSGINWTFWNKIIFSNSKGKWEYDIGSFAGQSGNGKQTQVVMGGKYETFDCPFDKLAKGYQMLVDGENPIIRFSGSEHYFDYRPNEEDMDRIKTALKLNADLKKINNKLEK